MNREIYLDMRFMMTDSVLMKVDKMSMASSLEIRVPLLDHVLVEFIASLPGDWKLKGLRTKHIFRVRPARASCPTTSSTAASRATACRSSTCCAGQLKAYMIDLLNDSPVIRENMNMDCRQPADRRSTWT